MVQPRLGWLPCLVSAALKFRHAESNPFCRFWHWPMCSADNWETSTGRRRAYWFSNTWRMKIRALLCFASPTISASASPYCWRFVSICSRFMVKWLCCWLGGQEACVASLPPGTHTLPRYVHKKRPLDESVGASALGVWLPMWWQMNGQLCAQCRYS